MLPTILIILWCLIGIIGGIAVWMLDSYEMKLKDLLFIALFCSTSGPLMIVFYLSAKYDFSGFINKIMNIQVWKRK